jgi:selenocysteine-specific elongation factor
MIIYNYFVTCASKNTITQWTMSSSVGDRASTSSNDKSDQAKILNVNVGVLGHVDSGKTSLVKTLSTMLSTAALDKSKESRERGMTLDLGFS